MRRCTCFLLATVFSCLFVSADLSAQTTAIDSGSQQNALKNSLTFFYASIGKQAQLYNGNEYYPYDPTITGNAYFLDIKAFTSGSVEYDGVKFTGVPMLYDVYSDNLVVLLYNHFTSIVLIKEKVSSFDFLTHHIINIDSLSLPANVVIKPGFYDEVYKGKLQVLVKRSKNLQTTSGQSSLETYFNPSIRYYIRKNNVYYEITGKGSALDLLKDKRKDIQKYLRANQINYRSDPIDALVKIASYYDHVAN